MFEQTAQIFVAPAEGAGFIGPLAGMNPTHRLVLGENSRPVWLLLSASLEGSSAEVARCYPTLQTPLDEGLLLVALHVVKDPDFLERAVADGWTAGDAFDFAKRAMSPELIDEAATVARGSSCRGHRLGWLPPQRAARRP